MLSYDTEKGASDIFVFQSHAFAPIVLEPAMWRLHKLDPALLLEVVLTVWQRQWKAKELE